MRLTGPREHYLTLFADCIAVAGVKRCAIYDLTRHEIHLFPIEFHRVLRWLTGRRIGDVLDALDRAPDGGPVDEFIGFLLDNELAMVTADPSSFPPLPLTWDFPGDVHDAIVDVGDLAQDFASIIAELDRLGCQFLQVRGFTADLSLQECARVVELVRDTSIAGVELIVRHEPSLTDDDYRDFLRTRPMVTALTVHSFPHSALPPRRNWEPGEGVRGGLTYTHQVIDSQHHCGIIAQRYLNVPTVAAYTEFRLFNGCLNRKISIDAAGHIRNCPSMTTSFGKVGERPLQAVVADSTFREPWHLRKDDIATCRSCEFRYVCSDCRAYVEDPADPRSKPLKCGYDPFTATWEPWHRPSFKWPVMNAYGIPAPATETS